MDERQRCRRHATRRHSAASSELREGIVQACSVRRIPIARGRSLDRAVSLSIDSLFDLELEARIVGIIVAAPADLEDHTGITFVSEGEDCSEALCGLTYVVCSRPVAGFAPNACQIGLRRDRRLWQEPSRFAVGGGMALETICIFGVIGLARIFERLYGMTVWAGQPRRELGFVAGLAGVRSDIICLGRKQVAARSGSAE